MMTLGNWKEYYASIGNEPSSLCTAVVGEYLAGERGAALDLGAGNGRNARWLAAVGFSPVVAVDSEPACEEYRTPEVDLLIKSLGKYVPKPDSFNFILAANTLPYLGKADTEKVLRRAVKALRVGGVFAFDHIGVSDERILTKTITSSLAHSEINALMEGMVRSGMQPLVAQPATGYEKVVGTGEMIFHCTWSFAFRKKVP